MTPRFHCLSDWLSWMETLHPSEIDLGLTRVKAVANRLDLLNLNAKVITVAGTNGKGSFVKALSSLLIDSGASVGTYTSPHIQSYNERIQLNGLNSSDDLICQAFTALDQARDTDTLTYFEFATLAALYIFKLKKLEYIILEVGLGGRLDAVNISDADISVITSIGIDHESWLGNTRESIGYEKAGILRQDKPFICVDEAPPNSVIEQANALGCPSYYVGREIQWVVEGERLTLTCLDANAKAQTLELSESHLPQPSLLAAAQTFALLVPGNDPAQVAAHLSTIKLEGRFQSKCIDGQACLLDVAHNPQAAIYLAKKLEQKNLKGLVVIFAAMRDKDIEGIVEALRPYVSKWVCTYIENTPRSCGAEELRARLSAINVDAVSAEAPSAAMATAIKYHIDPELPILIMGSFYLVSEFSIDPVNMNEKTYE